MEEIKINKAWYEGLAEITNELELLALKLDMPNLLSRTSYLKGYVDSLRTEFQTKQDITNLPPNMIIGDTPINYTINGKL